MTKIKIIFYFLESHTVETGTYGREIYECCIKSEIKIGIHARNGFPIRVNNGQLTLESWASKTNGPLSRNLLLLLFFTVLFNIGKSSWQNFELDIQFHQRAIATLRSYVIRSISFMHYRVHLKTWFLDGNTDGIAPHFF